VAEDGTIYFAGTSGINKLSPNGALSSFSTFSPTGLAVDAAGSVYASNAGGGIYKIFQSGVASIFAGAPGRRGSQDGLAANASFSGPAGLAFDANGNLYVADAGNHTVWKITPQGQVSTLAGTDGVIGALDGQGTGAQFLAPYSLTADRQGNLYIADGDGVRKLTPDGLVKHFAGKPGGFGYADGASSTALFNQSTGVVMDANGNLYVADRLNNIIRRVNANGDVTTFAGHAIGTTLATCSGSSDGDGFMARFNLPAGIAQDGSGNLYIADGANYTIRKITPTGAVTTIAGLTGTSGAVDGALNAARFTSPKGMAVDPSGNLYIADGTGVRMISPLGNVSTVNRPQGMWNISSVAFDTAGSLYVVGQVDATSNASAVYKRAIDGTFTYLGDDTGPVASDSAGTVYTVQVIRVGGSGRLCISPYCTSHYALGKFDPDGRFIELAQVPESANGLAIDPAGNIYISGKYAIYKVTPTGVVSTFAGQALNFSAGTRLGPLPGSLFSPAAMAVVTTGGVSRLVVTDSHAILSIAITH
jgi:sugar lactone lactonase YvrE